MLDCVERGTQAARSPLTVVPARDPRRADEPLVGSRPRPHAAGRKLAPHVAARAGAARTRPTASAPQHRREHCRVVRENYDDVLRIAGSLLQRHTTASQLVRALRSQTRHLATLARALQHIGRAPKTIHLLRLLQRRAVPATHPRPAQPRRRPPRPLPRRLPRPPRRTTPALPPTSILQQASVPGRLAVSASSCAAAPSGRSLESDLPSFGAAGERRPPPSGSRGCGGGFAGRPAPGVGRELLVGWRRRRPAALSRRGRAALSAARRRRRAGPTRASRARGAGSSGGRGGRSAPIGGAAGSAAA